MPTPLGSFEGARNAVIARVIESLSDDNEKIAAIKVIDERLAKAKTPVEISRVVEKGWLRTEDITDAIEAVETNITYVALMADLLRAVGKLSQLIIDTRSKKADEESQIANDYISDLLVYLSARKNGGDAIIISPDDVSGNFSMMGRSFLPSVASVNNASISIKSVNTNGIRGNSLEVTNDTEVNKPINSVKFVDPSGQSADISKATDNERTTVLELEALRVVPTEWVEFAIMQTVNGKKAPLNWNSTPSGGKLIAELGGKVVGGKISNLRIIPDLSNTEKITVEAIEYTREDGKKWYKAIGPHEIGKGTSQYVENATAGEGVWVIPGGRATNVKIRISQDTPYRTKIATVDYVASGTTGPLVQGPELSGINAKQSYFMPSSNVWNGNTLLERKLVARHADRWCIAIKDIDARANDYDRSCVFQTKTYDLPAPCDRLAISADELIPSGCTVKYEVSHDGVTWTSLVPMERTSGKEIVAFYAGGEANPAVDAGATYVQTKSPVMQLSLRISMTSKGTDAPVISNLSIHPILKR